MNEPKNTNRNKDSIAGNDRQGDQVKHTPEVGVDERKQSPTSLAGLEAVEVLAWTLRISDNPLLASIAALASVSEIRGAVTIEDNPVLPSCSVDAWLAPLGKACTCSGNDDAASCQ